jgi:hypothetical protein
VAGDAARSTNCYLIKFPTISISLRRERRATNSGWERAKTPTLNHIHTTALPLIESYSFNHGHDNRQSRHFHRPKPSQIERDKDDSALLNLPIQPPTSFQLAWTKASTAASTTKTTRSTSATHPAIATEPPSRGRSLNKTPPIRQEWTSQLMSR